MGDFTYERTEEKRIYETYEWDNTWLEYAYDENADRVLYIGDSISCQARRIITEKAEGNILFSERSLVHISEGTTNNEHVVFFSLPAIKPNIIDPVIEAFLK